MHIPNISSVWIYAPSEMSHLSVERSNCHFDIDISSLFTVNRTSLYINHIGYIYSITVITVITCHP